MWLNKQILQVQNNMNCYDSNFIFECVFTYAYICMLLMLLN